VNTVNPLNSKQVITSTMDGKVSLLTIGTLKRTER
jgi:hypothetical protein